MDLTKIPKPVINRFKQKQNYGVKYYVYRKSKQI